MKNTIKIIVFFVSIFATLLFTKNISNAATNVTNEETLLSAISSADSGATVTLQNDIIVTKPIVIAKTLTIDGNGHSVVGSSDWTSTSGNQTMFTAQLSDANLTLKNITLKNGPKYGVQSYDGATVTLSNVSITGFKYGGVLVNGGKVEVKDLHLGYNGTGSNNGIEIDKGSAATNNPVLVMNGKLTSDTSQNVVRVADNGYLTEFTVTNTDNTTNKIVLAGNKVLLTDANDNVIAETTLPEKVTVNADTQKVIVTLVANGKSQKIAVDSGKTITADLLKSHIDLKDNQVIDGFFTDKDYKNKFDFSKRLDKDTTIYAKISTEKKEENKKEEQTAQTTKKPAKPDNTPKTGVDTYIGLAIFAIVASSLGIVVLNKSK